jgi:hypothetical protein
MLVLLFGPALVQAAIGQLSGHANTLPSFRYLLEMLLWDGLLMGGVPLLLGALLSSMILMPPYLSKPPQERPPFANLLLTIMWAAVACGSAGLWVLVGMFQTG